MFLNSSFFTHLGFSPEFGVQALFLILGKQGNLKSNGRVYSPGIRPTSTLTDMLGMDAPSFSHSLRHLEKIIFFSVSGSLAQNLLKAEYAVL